LAVLIILFASTQFGLHLWPLSSLVYGVRIDYLSPTLYFLDLLIILYLALSKSYILNPKFLSLLPILLVDLLYSQNPLSTLNWSLHFLLYFSFLTAPFPQLGSLRDFRRSVGTSVISMTLTLSLLFQTILASIQIYLGHSVGGIMYYIGERMVSVGAPGIATTTVMGETVLRAYGTFSHPNILAGWAVISALIIRLLHQKLGMIALIPAALLVFLTDSHAASLSLLGIIVPLFFIKRNNIRLLYFACVALFSLYLFSPTRLDLSLSERLNLQGVSLKVVANFPIFGTGAQSSISTYPLVSPATRLLQPDHNSLTLFLSWFGIFGVFALLQQLRSSHDFRQVIVTLSPILPLLLLDHYLLTSPQGLFVLAFYLLIALNYPHAQKNRQ
jgi:hypothetical protein